MEPICPRCEPPRPSIVTSSCSSMKVIALSRGAWAETFLPFLVSCTLTHFMIPEWGCFCSLPSFFKTIPVAWGAPSSGSYFDLSPSAFLFQVFFSQRCCFLFLSRILPANSPLAISNILHERKITLLSIPKLRNRSEEHTSELQSHFHLPSPPS